MIAINDNVTTREETFIKIYKVVFPPIASFVSKNGGSFEDARDVFQDALIIYYEKVMVNTQSYPNQAPNTAFSKKLFSIYFLKIIKIEICNQV